ncbi:hypothetical protein K7X08_028710 [Anisodus acutangulus]|uniref:HECT-type E3 ubiquitin transferase n=1 Tax=Anisodus acutangulus TaxID=402998 RepID=A0A9Q1QS77_9SOLA|nr:hypothetical protein K7X08_028710 [Anisodus acutangulus]
MQRDQISSTFSCSFNEKSSTQIHFFVRLFSGGKTLVIQAYTTDTVEVIHDKIMLITGIPTSDQRLIYKVKQLQLDQTVSDCGIEKDASLQLVGQMWSTSHLQAWQLLNELGTQILDLCKRKLVPQDTKHVIKVLTKFLRMIPNDDDLAFEHLEIFISSSVPTALVTLYIGEKYIADECIYRFINSFKSEFLTTRYNRCAPIVLEFCKLLRGAAGIYDRLYKFCRCSLGAVVESTGIARCKADTKKLVALQDVFPFVREIATELSDDLVLTMGSTNFLGLSFSLVRDFTVFMLPVWNVICWQAPFGVPFGFLISFPRMEDDTSEAKYYKESIECLRQIFYDLLDKIVLSLRELEDLLGLKEEGKGTQVVLWWSQYLIILKELSNISKLYEELETVFWQKMRPVKASFCFLIIWFATKSEFYGWVLEHMEVTNSEVRRHLAMMMLPEVRYDEDLHVMLIDRSQLLEESFQYIGYAYPEQLRGGLFMEFKHEEATGPGVLREWFLLVCQAIFSPQNSLFVACPNDRRRFFPNPASKVDPLHLEYFCFCGRMIALALMHKIQIGVVFDRIFFLQLAGEDISLEDVRDADPCLYRSWKKLLEMDPEIVDQDTLGLTFVREFETLGSRKAVELCPNGKDTAVDSKNREKYVNLLIQHHFVTSIAEQVAHFANGFADVMTSSMLRKSFFRCLNLEDLDLMLDGSGSDVSVQDWKAHTDYNGYKESDPQISWFWKIVARMSAEQRKVLLFFWTSIKYLPPDGFGDLDSRLHIYKNAESYDHLPSSQTCFYQISFPPYQSMSVMRDRLRIITQEHVGCSFGSS